MKTLKELHKILLGWWDGDPSDDVVEDAEDYLKTLIKELENWSPPNNEPLEDQCILLLKAVLGKP